MKPTTACLSAGLAVCLPSTSVVEANGLTPPEVNARSLYRNTVAEHPGCPMRLEAGFPFEPIANARKRYRTGKGALFVESSSELGYGIVWGLGRDGRNLSPGERAAVARHRARNYPLSDSCAELTSFYRVVLGAYNREMLRLVEKNGRHSSAWAKVDVVTVG